jgi:hypothetical protein
MSWASRWFHHARVKSGDSKGMNRQEAEAIARQYLDSHCAQEVVILSNSTIEKEYGWIFDYEWKEYLEGKTRHPMIGNCPLLVEKSGKIILFPTSLPLKESIRRYEAGEPLVPSRKTQAG